MIKTKRKVEIPLHSEAFKILVKFKIKNKKPKDFIFDRRENASVNRDLKIIAKIAKIDKDVSSYGKTQFLDPCQLKMEYNPFI